MKNFVLILFLFNVCFALPAFSARSKSAKHIDEFYIPQNAVDVMQQTEDLSKSAEQEAHYYSRSRGRAPGQSSAQSRHQSSSAQMPQKKFQQAPVDKILSKQRYPKHLLEEYKKSITRTYSVPPNDLKDILQRELSEISAENDRMQQIKQLWNNQSPAYQFINYQLNTQINNEISASRKHFQRREKVFADFFAKAPANKSVYIIESTNPLFWLLSTNPQIARYSFSKNIYYVSIFDYSYNHLFTYHRMHMNANRNRRILAVSSGNTEIDNKFQNLFNIYSDDLKRIGLGLDVVNPTLLEQVETMQNGFITETY